MDIKQLIDRAIKQNVMVYDVDCKEEVISEKLKLVASSIHSLPYNYVNFDMIILLFGELRKYFDKQGSIVYCKKNLCLFYDSESDKVLLGAY